MEEKLPMTKPVPEKSAALLFTAFEPSGDALAAPVIQLLLKNYPEMAIYAWGGPRMAEAGATLIDNSVDDAAMGLSALKKISTVRRHIKRIKQWTKSCRVLGHVAVDSPAANFPICKIMRASGARVIHLAAPQLWAWGTWRARKLRKLTDMVLCLLPFEEQWFTDRDIPASFIGHPRLNRALDKEYIHTHMHNLPQGAPRLAIFPGSRPQEIRANLRLLFNVYVELQSRHAGMGGIIVAANGDLAQMIRKRIKLFPTGLHLITQQVDPCIAWCDLALAVSGTVTLDITRHCKPMIGVYRTSAFSWLASKILLRTPFCLLPNIIAGREIVPEFVPYCGGPTPIVKQISRYFLDSKNAAVQRAELARICQRYQYKHPAVEAARSIGKIIGLKPLPKAPTVPKTSAD